VVKCLLRCHWRSISLPADERLQAGESADAQYWALRAVTAASKAAQERILEDEHGRQHNALMAARTDWLTKLKAHNAAQAAQRRIQAARAKEGVHRTAHQGAEAAVQAAEVAYQAAQSTLDELRNKDQNTSRDPGSRLKYERESRTAQENWQELAWHTLLTRRPGFRLSAQQGVCWYGPTPDATDGAPCWEEAKASAEARLLGEDSASGSYVS
jgi:hypothetical protein